MDKLVAWLRVKCSMDTKGGRIVHVGLRECLVYDLDEFPDSTWSDLKDEFQWVLVDVQSDTSSLSGFVVRLRLRQNHRQRVLVTGALLAAMAAIVAHCLS